MGEDFKLGFWLCPLYKKEIGEGLCLDINYERLEYFKPGILKDTMKLLGKNNDEINCICESCPNMPLLNRRE